MSLDKEVTIYDIAAKLNISAATVSRGLKNHPGISVATKQRISDAATEMGYRFNSFASNLRSKRTNTIGVIVPRLNSNFMSDVIAGIEKVANVAGYNLIISQSLESSKKEIENARTMFNNRVDGLLVSLAYDTDDTLHIEQFINKDIPVVSFDRIFEHSKCPNISIDNYKAGYDATEHLLSQGRKSILHVTGNLKRNVYKNRFDGFKDALSKAAIGFNEEQLVVNDLSYASGIEVAKYILSLRDKPDAVFVANDNCAVACMLELKRVGIKIPQDIAFVGFNNDLICKVVEPNLSTINYSGEDMGQEAARELISILDSNRDQKAYVKQLILSHQLIVRDSSLNKIN